MKKMTLIPLICLFCAGCTPQAMQSIAQILAESAQSPGVDTSTTTRYPQRETYRVYTGSATPGQYTIERTY